MTVRPRILNLLLFLILCHPAYSQDQRAARAVRTDVPVVIDGDLSDTVWSRAEVIDVPYEVDPRENAAAPQRTEVRIAYDDQMVYAAFVCYETDMTKVRANITDRDRMYQDDYAILVLDTYNDKQKGFMFFVNPLNIQGDALRSGNNEDDSYEMVWYSATRMHSDRWVVEMGIPLKSIRFPDAEKQLWNILVGRGYPRETKAILSASKFDRNNPCLLCQGLPLTGIEGIKPGLAMEFLPYTIGTQQGKLRDTDDPATPFEQGKILGRAGVGVKVSPTPDLVVEGVLNPDFSQIESDAAQISVNTTFALFYPERRPFFLEGADLFRPGLQSFDGPALQVFYSRTVNDPLVAAKVLGKSGALSYGIISASDRNTNVLVPGEEGSDFAETGKNSLVNVGRLRYDLGDESYVGGIASTRFLSGAGSNIVAGADWNYRFWENHAFSGIVFGSRTEEPNDPSLFSDTRTFGSTGRTATYDGETLNGFAAKVQVGRSARNVNYSVSYEDASPLFMAHNGFIARTNKRAVILNYGRTYYPEEGGLVNNVSLSALTGLQLNYDGIRKERFFVLQSSASLRGQINLWAGGLLLNQEQFRGVYFTNIPRGFFGFYMNPTAYLTLNANVEAGNFVYRDTPPELGYGHNIFFWGRVRLTDRFNVSLQYIRARLSSSATGNLYYDGNIYRTTAIYQFTPGMFVRLIGQYDSFAKGVNIYPLFSFKLNPFTVFYAGATRDASNFGGTTGFETTRTNYFLKMQYLIQG